VEIPAIAVIDKGHTESAQISDDSGKHNGFDEAADGDVGKIISDEIMPLVERIVEMVSP